MACEACAFEANRLLLKEWHSLSRNDGELARVVTSILSGPVTRSRSQPLGKAAIQ